MARTRKYIRQNRTEFQKAFDKSPGLVKSVSWTDRLPDFIHIGIALVDNDFLDVELEYNRLLSWVKHHAGAPNNLILGGGLI